MPGPDPTTPVAVELLDALSFRCIGPPRGGRVVAVAGDPSQPATFYFGAVAGGVWKTTDAGLTWRSVSDGQLATGSVGALAVSDSDPNVVYAGMGEGTIRGDVSHGDGVYRSGDGGRTWKHCGLADTRHISEIVIHPRDPDRVYVAAFGHAFGPNAERGVFRTDDGGRSWRKVLHVDERTGAADLSLDPYNPEILYASMWQAHRNFWELSSGGPGSGIWRSDDGGDTWTDITRNRGLPGGGLIGKVGLSASPAAVGRVWALIESEEDPGLYRSDDFGKTWDRVSDRIDLRYRPWYYMHVFADPVDPDTVYVNNLSMWRSDDGGRTFVEIGTPHGDNHDLWIDPSDNSRMIQSNDGGANVSFNGGASWSPIHNQLTAQFYTVTTDDREPYYHVYGTQQDNTSIAVPSGTNDEAITWADCYAAGTGESGFVAVDPRDPDIVYVGAVGSSPGGGGALQRHDLHTGQIRLVNVWPQPHGGIGPGDLRYRFPWTFPILFSPHDPGVLYSTGNVVFRSTDEGQSWEPISPDLTRNDPDKLGPSGGPITKDTSGAEHYCTISTLRESVHEPGVLWVGTDDGLVHLSPDGGRSWTDVTPPDLPEWAFVRTVEPSPHDPATAYVAATRYKLDDARPWVFVTTDRGATWQPITGEGDGALPEDTIVRVVRADPEVEGLLYLGTETGLYVTSDGGVTWRRWEANLPVSPIYDLTVKGDDLVLATHGRSFWILDDLTPLRRQADRAGAPAHLFPPPRTWRILPTLLDSWTATEGRGYSIGVAKVAVFDTDKDESGQVRRTFLDAGTSPRPGVTLHYHLAEADPEAISLDVLDADGEVVRSFGPKPPGHDKLGDDEKAHQPGPWLPVAAGLNHFRWDLRHPGSTRLLGNKLATEANTGPLVLPGRHRARLTVRTAAGEHTSEQSFDVVNDPRVDVAEADLREQHELLLRIRDTISAAYDGVLHLRSVRDQLELWRTRLGAGGNGATPPPEGADRMVERLEAILADLAEVENELIVPGEQKDTFRLDDPSRLTEQLASLIPIVGSADARPTEQARELTDLITARIDEQLERLERILDADVGEFNTMVHEADVPAVA